VGTGAVLTAECLALGGKIPEAHDVLDSFLKQSPNHAEVLLQKARIEEMFAANFNNAVAVYRQVLKTAKEPELLVWLKGKLEYLEGGSGLKNVQVSAKGE
jgi:tetratricopeptide (TPR) repeat protein